MDLVEIKKAMPSVLKGKMADPFGKVPEGTGPYAASKLRSKRIGVQAGQLKREGDIRAFKRKRDEGRTQMWNRREMEAESNHGKWGPGSPGSIPVSQRSYPKQDLSWIRGRREGRRKAAALTFVDKKPTLRDRTKAKVLKLRNRD